MALKNIGVLWTKNKNGKSFLSGNIDNGIHGDISIMVFRNEDKKNDKAPDYRIVMRMGDGEEKQPQPVDDFIGGEEQRAPAEPTVDVEAIPF